MSAVVHWGQPWALLLLPAVLAAVAVAWWLARRRERRLVAAGVAAPALTSDQHRGLARLRVALQGAGLLLLAVAAAQPRWGVGASVRGGSGYQIAVVLDCSRSMLATDYYPDRSQAARRKAADLLRIQPEHRVAVIPFAAIAHLRVPLTGDHAVLQELLEQCGPDLFDEALQGTSIGQAVRLGVETLARAEPGGRAILIMSDGGDPDATAVAAAAREARAADIPIYGLLVGDAERQGSITINGRPQAVPPDATTLRRLADDTGGLQVTATDDNSDLASLLAHMESRLARQAWRERSQVVAAERYQWLLLPALLVLAVGLLLGTRRRTLAVMLAAVLLPVSGAEPSATAPVSWDRLQHAVDHLAGRDPGQAVTELQALVVEQPHFHALRYTLGTLLLATDPGSAAEHLLAATNASDGETARRAWFNLALARHRQGRAADAASAAAEALRRAGDDADTQRLHEQLRRAALEAADAERLAREAAARRLRIPAQRLPEARAATPYGQRVTAQGGRESKRFRADAGGPPLPSWLRLDADGRLHGTPPTGSDGELRLGVAVDDGATSATAVLTLRVLPPPRILTERFDDAVRELPWQGELRVSGLDGGRWQVSGLPPGLALAVDRGATARLAGTPTQIGAFPLAVIVSDGVAAATAALLLHVVDGFAIDSAAAPLATRLHPYRHRLGVRGPAGTYRFRADTRNGLTVDEQGRIAGAPRDVGASTLLVTASDSAGRSASAAVVITVVPPPDLTGPPDMQAQVGKALDQAIERQHGSPPFTWSLADGALPAGLELTEGRLRGVPAAAGERRLVVAVRDRWGAEDRQPIDLRIAPAEPPRPSASEQGKPQPQNGQGQPQNQQQAQNGQQDRNGQQQNRQQHGQQDDGDGQQDQAQRQDGRGDQQSGGQQGQVRGDGGQRAGGGEGQGSGEERRAAAAALDAAAARRWLDSLPAEDRRALRALLLRGAQQPDGSAGPAVTADPERPRW